MVERNELIEYMELDAYRPLTVQELADEFDVESGDDFRDFMKLLNELEDKGEIVRTRANRYGIPERMNLVVGHLHMKARGYGFLIPETAGDPDVYIPATEMNGALSGDKVMARVEKSVSGPRREGRIIRILERAQNRVVGKFTRHKDHAFVSPTDKRFPQDIFIGMEDMMDAHDGYIVVAEITEYPTATRGPEGKVIEVLGHPDAPGIDILTVIKKYGLPETFPDEVLAAAEEIPLELSEADLAGRRDLRHETIVTIDGEDAKDLDDAVHVRQLENGNYLLGVSIADVGYYVKEDSQLDREAFKRGTSVYLVDRVIPMLPQRLSNNICSLNPHVDRLTLTCEMEITPEGDVVNHDVFPSVIKTTERMTYTNVRKILDDCDKEVIERYKPLVPLFELMEELALILRDKRMRRGAIDFDFEEVKVIVDDLGHPVDIVPRTRSIAERIIEEFMLAANETVAEHFHWMEIPFVYRIHEEPEMDRMMEFNEFVHNFGYHVKGLGNKIHPRSLQDILEKTKGTREERVIASLMLRSMKQARYAPECVGHFGLAAEFYTHFTSPIRRYPDLMIHRIIREATMGELSEERLERLKEKVASGSVQSSERERVAQDAEREVDQMKMVEYMLDHIGEEYQGIINGVTQFGLFIQLTNGVEGLIHISYLADDYYVYHEKQMALVGERTRRVFRLGDPVQVKCVGANKQELTIDFELVEHLREGTLTYDSGVASVVYDEDLSPKERRRQQAERQQNARWQPSGGRGAANRDGRGGTGSGERGSRGNGGNGRGRRESDTRDGDRRESAHGRGNGNARGTYREKGKRGPNLEFEGQDLGVVRGRDIVNQGPGGRKHRKSPNVVELGPRRKGRGSGAGSGGGAGGGAGAGAGYGGEGGSRSGGSRKNKNSGFARGGAKAGRKARSR